MKVLIRYTDGTKVRETNSKSISELTTEVKENKTIKLLIFKAYRQDYCVAVWRHATKKRLCSRIFFGKNVSSPYAEIPLRIVNINFSGKIKGILNAGGFIVFNEPLSDFVREIIKKHPTRVKINPCTE